MPASRFSARDKAHAVARGLLLDGGCPEEKLVAMMPVRGRIEPLS
jgi:hypothetical protein